ncbi:unnamed protein product, partial [Closterium sp. Naga37s-1]
RRRVYLDLGGKEFNSSVLWMLRHYPLDFTEVHVFEVKKGLFLLPPRQTQNDEAQYPEIQPRKRLEKVSVFWRGDEPPPVPNWMADRIHIYNDFVDNTDYHKHVNITRFIKDVLRLTAGDTLVVKMDIEGKEWDVLPGECPSVLAVRVPLCWLCVSLCAGCACPSVLAVRVPLCWLCVSFHARIQCRQ